MVSNLLRFFLIHTSICLAESFILRLPCITLADFTVVHKDRSLNGNVIREITGIDDTECTKQCVKHPRCFSYNIHFGLKICQLNEKTTEDFGSQLSLKDGWIYKSTDYNETQIGSTCKSLNPCEKNILCKEKCTPPYYECVYCKKGYSGLHCQHHEAINGSWSSWGAFGDCNRQCGGGTQTRFRSCNEPAPAFGGESCHGNEADIQPCNTDICPEHIGCYPHFSNETQEGHQLSYLLDDNIECPGQTSVLKRFRFQRILETDSGRYYFECCEFNASLPYTVDEKGTDFMTIESDTRLLAKHKLSCENNGQIRNMKFEKNPSQDKFRYIYACYQLSNSQYQKQSVCYNDVTGWNENSNGDVIYLDRHNVVCSKLGFGFNEIQLKIDPNNDRQWRYEFRCCKILFW